MIVNAASGRLADTDIAVGDAAVEVCPIGAILVKRRGFEVPIGRRIYDLQADREVAIEDVRAQREDEGG